MIIKRILAIFIPLLFIFVHKPIINIMMSVNKTILGITTSLILITSLLVYVFIEKKNSYYKATTNKVQVDKTWKLPEILKEISGIAFLEKNKIAGIQDEKGTIYIYNLKNAEIEKEIDFGGAGDYEGIAIVNSDAYVLRADGKIYEVANFLSKPEVKQYETHLSAKQDVEGLTYDKTNNRLLLAIKEKDPNMKSKKGIYGFDLKTRKAIKNPVFTINLKDSAFVDIKEKKLQNIFKPSEIAINPGSGEIILLEAENPKMLILDKKGNIKNLYYLNRKKFPQPEGLTFAPDGAMYISNEGSPATIYKVSLK